MYDYRDDEDLATAGKRALISILMFTGFISLCMLAGVVIVTSFAEPNQTEIVHPQK